MEAIFKPEHVGQVVSDPNFGDGVITGYDHRTTYPVEVKFEPTGITRWYKPEGWHNGCVLATLQFGPLDNWHRRTEPMLKDGDLVELEILGMRGSWSIHEIVIDNGVPRVALNRDDNGNRNSLISLDTRKWRLFKP